MFDLNKIPTIIENKKHGKRYSVDLIIKQQIRVKRFAGKKTISYLMKEYKLPHRIINIILKETT